VSNINDLNLSDDPIPAVDLDNLPPEGFESPQPGTYVITLPTKMDCWEKLATDQGQRVRANFKKTEAGDFRLKYKGAASEGLLSLSLSNVQFGKRPSKLAYLAAALGYKGEFTTNREIVDAISAAAGKSFIANITYSASNKNTGQKWATRGYTNKQTGKVTKPIPHDANGKSMMEFVDDGTLLRCWPDLESFKPAQ
jgi:hypothetical protein